MNTKKENGVWAVLVFIGFLGLFLITLNQIFSFDAITNAIAAEAGEPIRWFHPNHLFYPFIPALWYHVETLIGYKGWGIYSVARFNSILAALGLAIFWFQISQLSSRRVASAIVLFLGSSFAVWHYAVDGRAIGTMTFWVALLFFQITRIWLEDKFTSKSIFILALLSTGTVLFHGISIFHVIPVAILIILTPKISLKNRQIFLSIYFGTILMLLTLFYGLAYRLVPEIHQNQSSFFQWILGYAGFFETSALSDIPFIGRFDWGLVHQFWKGWVHALTFWPGQPANPDSWIAHFIGALSAVGIGILLWKGIQAKGSTKNLVLVFLAWAFLSSLFLLFWSPGQEGFRLLILIPLLCAAALVIPPNGILPMLLMLLGVIQFSLNLAGPITYNANLNNNRGYIALSEIEERVENNALILTMENGTIPSIEVQLPYFFRNLRGGSAAGRLYAFKENTLTPLALDLLVALERGVPVYISEDFFNPIDQERFEKNHHLPEKSISNFLNQFKTNPPIKFSTAPNLIKLSI